MSLRTFIGAGLLGLAVTACTAGKEEATATMANPASTYCIEQGGEVEIRQEESGAVGYCHLPDGTVIEEWEYFRAAQE